MSQFIAKEEDNRGYRDSFKASAVLGGSQGVSYILSLLRTKALAYLLGPAGIGLVGLYTSIAATVGTVSSLGIGESGIREIAATHGNVDQEKLSRTMTILRRACLISGIFGLILCVALALPLSNQVFGNSDHTLPIAILGFTLLLGTVSSGETALIQGTGRVAELAKLNIISSIAGMLPVILVYVWFREKGIVPALLLSSVLTLGITCYFSRTIHLPTVKVTWREMVPETKLLLALGFAFMATGLLGTGKDMVVRTMITQNHGLVATGLYQSAWAVSGLFANFVLKAMGMDFYPRLTSMIDDHEAMIRAVNQQIEVGILLVLPGVIATITCAPLVLSLLYSSKFNGAAGMLAVLASGVFLKMASYPINTIQLAKGDARGFASIAIFCSLLELAMTVALLLRFGLIGAAIAYPISCLFHVFIMAWVGKRMIGFRPQGKSLALLVQGIVLVVMALLIAFLVQGYIAFGCGLILSFFSFFYCARELTRRLGREHRITRMISRLPLLKSLLPEDE
jgi:enterobacterial common antigen flippase